MMKKTLTWCLTFGLCLLALFGCGKTERPTNGTFRVFCTTFPVYDWLSNVTADASGITVTLLDTHGADLHSYQPTVADMAALAECDLVVYIGGESDKWVKDAVENAGTDVKGTALLDLLGDRVKTEETVEGMQTKEHEHEHGQEAHDHDAPEADEHVWLSLKNAVFFVDRLCAQLCEADAAEADKLRQAAEAYIAELESLDASYETAVKSARLTVFEVADRFPFRYLADDYGLTYYAAFPGCSTETDAGFDTVIFLADKVDEYSFSYIAVTESADGAVVGAVLEAANKKDVSVVTLDSLQSVSQTDIQNGKSYLSAMKENLAALQSLLS